LRAIRIGSFRALRSRRSNAPHKAGGFWCALLLLVALFIAPAAARAQAAADQKTGSLVGVVVDTLGAPIRDASVLIASLRRTTRTLDDGTFRFDSLPSGLLRLTARAVGYIGPGENAIIVRGETARVSFRMLRLAASIAAMTVRASRPGLAGIVGDTAYHALDSVRVKALGKSALTTTDSVGGFYLPLKPGAYMLRLDRTGFATQMVGVHMPDDSGKKVSVLMTPDGPMDAVEIMRQMSLFELENRLLRASPIRYRTFSREALQRFGASDLLQSIGRATAQRMSPDACAAINGGPETAPLWSIDLDDVEFVEANLAGFGAMAGSRGPTSINGMTARGASPTGTEFVGRGAQCTYAVWFRR